MASFLTIVCSRSVHAIVCILLKILSQNHKKLCNPTKENNLEKYNKKLLTTNYRQTILTNVETKKIINSLLQDKEEGNMMPLTMVKTGEENTIKKVGGKEETRRFLENLGFVVGGVVTVVSEIGGNMIVNVKDSRVAIGKDMANKIMVQVCQAVSCKQWRECFLPADK